MVQFCVGRAHWGEIPVFFYHLLISVQASIDGMRIDSKQIRWLIHCARSIDHSRSENRSCVQIGSNNVLLSDLCKKRLSMHTTSITQ